MPWDPDERPWNQPWKPLSRAAALAWGVFYALFMLYALIHWGQFLFIDNVNLVVHEAGHPLFGWFGPTLGLWGGTLLQWLVPLLLAAWFYGQRQPPGFAFALFFFFENLLYTATYMADARAMALPLVTVGDPDVGGHDWNNIFSSLGLLPYDTRIAAATRFLGWIGMLGVTVWLMWRGLHKEQQATSGK
jgi:hypothetical protein